jgi:FAD/FMN-containing dehydrogenase
VPYLTGLDTFDDVLRTFKEARSGLGEILSSCEMMDILALDAATTNLKLQRPIGEFPFYMLIETSGSNGTHDEEKLTSFLESLMASGVVRDGTVASEPSRIKVRYQYINCFVRSCGRSVRKEVSY